MAMTVLEPGQVPGAFQKAFYLMRSGRPGPVLLDLPLDVQLAEIEFDIDVYEPLAVHRPAATRAQAEKVLDMLCSARRPLIVAGGDEPGGSTRHRAHRGHGPVGNVRPCSAIMRGPHEGEHELLFACVRHGHLGDVPGLRDPTQQLEHQPAHRVPAPQVGIAPARTVRALDVGRRLSPAA